MAAKKKQAEQPKGAPKKGKLAGDAPTRDQRAASVRDYVNTKMKGRAQLKPASEYSLPFLHKRYPTGLLTLDAELRGGFPGGGISQIIGPNKSGKTYLTWCMIRQLQYYLGDKLKCLLAMTELRADRSQARLAGVQIAYSDEDIQEMETARERNGLPPFSKDELTSLKHEVGEIDEAHGMDAESLYDVVLRSVEENVYHLIVIDSFGSIMSGAEAEAESLSDKTYGGASGVNTQFLRKLCSMLAMDDDWGRSRDTCIIGINQIRDNIKDPNKEYKAPGGNMLAHSKLVDVYVSSGKALGDYVSAYTPEGWGKIWQATGKEVNWKIEKGKAGMHEGGRGKYVYSFSTNSADFYTDALVAGVSYGVVETAGAWIGIPDGNGGYLARAQGRDNFVKALHEDVLRKAADGDTNASLINYIRTEVFKRQGINVNYAWSD